MPVVQVSLAIGLVVNLAINAIGNNKLSIL